MYRGKQLITWWMIPSNASVFQPRSKWCFFFVFPFVSMYNLNNLLWFFCKENGKKFEYSKEFAHTVMWQCSRQSRTADFRWLERWKEFSSGNIWLKQNYEWWMNEWSVCQMNADTKACMLLGRVLFTYLKRLMRKLNSRSMQWNGLC